MKTSTFICQLSKVTQKEIKKDIITFLKDNDFSKEEQAKILNNAMDGRLCDLEENLDILKYIALENLTAELSEEEMKDFIMVIIVPNITEYACLFHHKNPDYYSISFYYSECSFAGTLEEVKEEYKNQFGEDLPF